MNYTEYQPSPSLAKYLECIWFASETRTSPASGTAERVLPDGCVEWIFHLGLPFRRWLNEKWEVQPRSFVVGELTRFILLQPTGPTATMGVRFRPGGAYHFLPFPLDLLTDEAVPVGDIWGREGEHLEDAVLDAPNDARRRLVVEKFLTARLLNTEPHEQFDAAVSVIMQSRGQTRVAQLAAVVGWSPRQLEREFRTKAGLSPKALARIIRFQSLLQLVGEAPLRQWASLALEGGYADQSHMVREFREFAGQSPTDDQANLSGNLARNFISPRRLAALLGTA